MAGNVRMICVLGSKIDVEWAKGFLERLHQHSFKLQCRVKYVMPSGICSQAQLHGFDGKLGKCKDPRSAMHASSRA